MPLQAAVSASPALGDEEDAPTPGVSAVSDLLKPSTLLNLDAPIPTTTQVRAESDQAPLNCAPCQVSLPPPWVVSATEHLQDCATKDFRWTLVGSMERVISP